jgi:2-keto-4-pentenoate hydratase/2-oxohepta-3-ene-1,7-dioic acid hydratase in catechol pathway
MRLLTFEPAAGAAARAGALMDERVVDLAALAATAGERLPDDVLGLARDAERVAVAERLLGDQVPDDVTMPLGDVRLRAPLRPGKIVGVGLNYVEHVEESARTLDTDKDLPERPVLFSKPSTAVVGPGEPIIHNAAMTSQLDWECELAVVIGKRAKRVSKDDSLEHVFGYSIVNDISARDQRRSGQWFYSKGQDTYAPFGPWIVTAD